MPFEEQFNAFDLHEERNDNFAWVPRKEIYVVKVHQDSSILEVFKDASGVYYTITKLSHLAVMNSNTLTLERYGFKTRLRDVFGNEFRMREWYKIKDLMYKGQPLFTYKPPTSTARLGQTMYTGETRAPNLIRQCLREQLQEDHHLRGSKRYAQGIHILGVTMDESPSNHCKLSLETLGDKMTSINAE